MCKKDFHMHAYKSLHFFRVLLVSFQIYAKIAGVFSPLNFPVSTSASKCFHISPLGLHWQKPHSHIVVHYSMALLHNCSVTSFWIIAGVEIKLMFRHCTFFFNIKIHIGCYMKKVFFVDPGSLFSANRQPLCFSCWQWASTGSKHLWMFTFSCPLSTYLHDCDQLVGFVSSETWHDLQAQRSQKLPS